VVYEGKFVMCEVYC